MEEVVIVEAVRTPVGRFRGALADVRADHLAAATIDAALARIGLSGDRVDEVILGCVTQIGEQSGGIARTAVLSSSLPESVPGLTVDRKCGSGEAAVHLGAGLIATGACQVVLAGGAENMTRVPMGSNRALHGEVYGARLLERFEMIAQGEAAERIADIWGFSRDQLDDFAFESHARAIAADVAGAFVQEIAPLPVSRWQEPGAADRPDLLRDETIRADTTRERLGTLKTPFREAGRLSAGNSSQISDGAALLVLMSGARARELGLRPRARIVATATVGSDPTLMLTGPIPATARVLANAGLSIDDIDLFEVNEAFASVPMAWMAETGVGRDRLNVQGGAIALGHPLGASGARIMVSLLHALEQRGLRHGLQTVCCATGMATATIIERL